MFHEANSLMAQVLRDHPQSGKAHFVQAELLAKQGQLLAAQTELSTAERLAPGLPFAKPGTLQALTTQLSRSTGSRFDVPGPSNQGAGGQLLWQLILAAIVVLIAGYFIFRRQADDAGVPYAMAGALPASGSHVPASQGFAAADYSGGPAASPANAPGLGRTLMGGLATGAAVGAGMLAGQALMHRVMDDSPTLGPSRPLAAGTVEPAPLYDMGGANFGVASVSSWDEAGASSEGAGEWN